MLSDYWSRLAGGRKLAFDNVTYLSEMDNIERNMAIAYLLRSKGAISKE